MNKSINSLKKLGYSTFTKRGPHFHEVYFLVWKCVKICHLNINQHIWPLGNRLQMQFIFFPIQSKQWGEVTLCLSVNT